MGCPSNSIPASRLLGPETNTPQFRHKLQTVQGFLVWCMVQVSAEVSGTQGWSSDIMGHVAESQQFGSRTTPMKHFGKDAIVCTLSARHGGTCNVTNEQTYAGNVYLGEFAQGVVLCKAVPC